MIETLYDAGDTAEAMPPANVLIVDDVAQNLIAMQALLAREGINVLSAASGAEALELLLLHDVAVALLDVNMPGMNGFELAELMRGTARTAAIPIIFLTASAEDPRRAFQGYDAGAVDFLHKPIEPHVIEGKVKVFVDLHRQRQLLASRAERLERALALNETMLAVMTHDLRTPLSVISLCANTLSMLPDTGQNRILGQRIHNSAMRMARMIEQLLDFSRIRSGGLRLAPRPVDVAQVAQQAIDEVRQSHPDRAVLASRVGRTAGTVDPDRLAQVVSNLVSNAVHHAQGGEIRVLVDGAQPDTLRIEVSNAGAIPEELLPRLFEPFKGSFHASSGLGLGLYIVDQFVRAHGGSTSARNVDASVVMTVQLPRHCADAGATSPAEADAAVRVAAPAT